MSAIVGKLGTASNPAQNQAQLIEVLQTSYTQQIDKLQVTVARKRSNHASQYLRSPATIGTTKVFARRDVLGRAGEYTFTWKVSDWVRDWVATDEGTEGACCGKGGYVAEYGETEVTNVRVSTSFRNPGWVKRAASSLTAWDGEIRYVAAPPPTPTATPRHDSRHSTGVHSRSGGDDRFVI